VVALLHQLPAVLAGKASDPTGGAMRALLMAMGVQALTIIKTAFLEKSRGGTDEAGITWAPLSLEYVAYKRRHPGLPPAKDRGKRYSLNKDQDKLWRGVYAGRLAAGLRKGLTQTEASGRAAAIAWIAVKAAGAHTLLDAYGHAPTEIGRDTGRMFNSLSPGAVGDGADQQILEPIDGGIKVGTNVKYAIYFHAKRPLWPEDDNWPDVWLERLTDMLQDGLELLVTKLMT
jgi:hypothetical protein